ncbi:hypothetical protein A2U01_0007593 [Trifolium medium]|uniref:Uncharacterized protein n=1 Tax=Trifolium medium TaxID=97028 RepID=A0A392MHR8_9FABA|nr:hypothetical protein [Trifolium medium]
MGGVGLQITSREGWVVAIRLAFGLIVGRGRLLFEIGFGAVGVVLEEEALRVGGRVTGMKEMLPLMELSSADDYWYWNLYVNGKFTSPATFKVVSFSWKLLSNRIPTKCNLIARGNQVCVLVLTASAVGNCLLR